jgi:adenylate cyclase
MASSSKIPPYMSSHPSKTGWGSILVIDDTLDNLRLLTALLKTQGYEVRAFTNGQMALASAKAKSPDLILLDINMPDMNGYETCRRFKAETKTQDVPIIFISVLDEVLDKMQAFAAGGVDYITKPFQLQEVLARIETHLNLRRLQQQLQDQNTRLQVAEEKYRSIFENAIEGIFQITPAGRYLSANPALARIYGCESPQDLIDGMTDTRQKLYIRPGRWEELKAYLRYYGEITGSESAIYRKDGSVIWVEENIRAVGDADKTPLYYEGMVQDITERREAEEELRVQRQRAERLLVNILPPVIAEQLKQGQPTIANNFDQVTVLFADLVDFTALSTRVGATELVKLLNHIFSIFDQLVDRYNLEKIKTIGDSYMAAGGIPIARLDHAEAIADLALDMQQSILSTRSDNGEPFQLRIGINSGSVVAGVIGTKKFAYDLWGDTVNVASRMESQGESGRIQVAPSTYELLKDKYLFTERGAIDIKGKGKMNTYWLTGKRP